MVRFLPKKLQSPNPFRLCHSKIIFLLSLLIVIFVIFGMVNRMASLKHILASNPENRIKPYIDKNVLWTCAKRSKMSVMAATSFWNQSILILTPISDSEKFLATYFKNLCSLMYPWDRISVVLGQDSSIDRTLLMAKLYVAELHQYFSKMTLIDFDKEAHHEPWGDSHKKEIQYKRRRSLAISRNLLLKAALQEEQWVLWLDSDVKEIPPDLIQRLLKAKKDLVAPACMYRKPITGYPAVYDRNTWRETNESLLYLRDKPQDFLMLEGYETSLRDTMNKLQRYGDLVELDGVGGCVLMVRASCHKKGLLFPSTIYKHHIETEGLAKMAKDMGFSVYGLPRLRVFHH